MKIRVESLGVDIKVTGEPIKAILNYQLAQVNQEVVMAGEILCEEDIDKSGIETCKTYTEEFIKNQEGEI